MNKKGGESGKAGGWRTERVEQGKQGVVNGQEAEA